MSKEQILNVPFEGKQEQAVRIGFKIGEEEWNKYNLDDGTSMRMKTVVTDIVRLVSKIREDGQPIYLVKSTNLVESVSPDNLVAKPEDVSKAN